MRQRDVVATNDTYNNKSRQAEDDESMYLRESNVTQTQLRKACRIRSRIISEAVLRSMRFYTAKR